MSTTARVLIGLALGMLVGLLSTFAGDDFAGRLAAVVSPLGTLWLNALRMTVVPLVVSLVIVGVADASSAAAAGRPTTVALGLFIALLTAVSAATAVVAPAVYALWPWGSVSRDTLLPGGEGGPAPSVPGVADQLANPYKVNVQVVGEFLRISATAFKRVLQESTAMSQLLLRYGLVSIQRGAQNAACIQHHTIEERMCRWLLETAHRKGEDQFGLTQEFLSDMLGVRRQSVNLTARVLQQANLITYHRGELTILDRAGLEETSCECFRVTTEMYERAMKLP